MTPNEWDMYLSQMSSLMTETKENAEIASEAVSRIQSLNFYLDPLTGDLYYEMD